MCLFLYSGAAYGIMVWYNLWYIPFFFFCRMMMMIVTLKYICSPHPQSPQSEGRWGHFSFLLPPQTPPSTLGLILLHGTHAESLSMKRSGGGGDEKGRAGQWRCTVTHHPTTFLTVWRRLRKAFEWRWKARGF